MKKYKYKLENLDCANCANKIENHLNKDKNLNNVIVNFSRLTLSFETDLEKDILEYVTNITHEVEDDVIIIPNDKENHHISFKYEIYSLIIGIILTIIGSITSIKYLTTTIIILAYIILLKDIIIKAIKILIKSHTIDEHLLITISCIGAYFTNNVIEGLMVVILYNIGELLEHIAVNNSRKSISELMDIKPEYANLKENNIIKVVSPEEVNINDIIVVKKGEKIPLDGIVIKGESKLDTSALTGESKPSYVKINDKVLSGSINLNNILEIKVTNNYENSTVSRILELVENATDRKTHTENFVSQASKIYTPIIIILAISVALFFPFIFNISINESIYRALIFLVVSCPCAIVISVPLSYFTGIGAASKKGILIKGSDYLDGLKDINKIIFDKTGTLTTGKFNDIELTVYNNKYSKKQIINYYCLGESLSNHPIAKSIVNYYNEQVNTKDIKKYKEISGQGISYEIDKDKIKIGNSNFVESNNKNNFIYLKVNNEIIASIVLKDSIKDGVIDTIKELNNQNIKTMMFTGDDKNEALDISNKIGLKSIKYEQLPEEKYQSLELEIIHNERNKKVAFVGDGINDAPSLARADIGISMGNVGSACAIEASDVVIINDDIKKISTAINISKKTNKIIKENIIFALSIKVIVLILSAMGISSMWQAVFADTGVTLLTILNTTRLLKTSK